jgi:hypothetical protein
MTDALSKMTPLDQSLWLSADNGDLTTLSAAVHAAHQVVGEHVTVETVVADAEEPLSAIRPTSVRTELRRAGLVSLLKVDDDQGPFVLGAWPTGQDSIFHLVGSVPTTDPRWRKVARWIANAAPAVVPCFLNHDDFVGIGTVLSEYGEVEVGRLSARKRSDLSSLNRGWPARVGSLRPSHHEAISEAENEGASVRSLTLSIADVISFHLRRVAGATFYSGDFGLFERCVLAPLAVAANRRRTLLIERHRTVGEAVLEPISIRLPGPTLADYMATGEVLAELERQRSTAVSVLHRNPYLHVAVTDYTDGSNYDVFVTTPDAIEIIPGFRASMGALAKVTQRLGERFEALEIAEAPRPGLVSLDDLVDYA